MQAWARNRLKNNKVEGLIHASRQLQASFVRCWPNLGGDRLSCSDWRPEYARNHVRSYGSGEWWAFLVDNLFFNAERADHGHLTGRERDAVNQREAGLPVGMELLGRVIDGVGNPLDGLGPLYTDPRASFNAEPINPLARKPISEPLDVGLKAINGLLTVGKGQRIGLFTVLVWGKSVTLGMMTPSTHKLLSLV